MRSRPFTAAVFLFAAIIATSACSDPVSSTPDPTPEPGPAVTWRESEPVAPLFVGSGGFGYSFGSSTVSAAAPNGLVKVGPDTKGPWGTVGFLHFSGYWYGDDTIQGFSHMHLHGTGATDYGVLGVMPSDGFDETRTTQEGYASTFQKANEIAEPGRYQVTLDRGNIAVELTATTHAAHHRYTYAPSSTTAHVILDLDHHLSGGEITDAEFTLDPATNRIRGRLHSLGGMSKGFGGYDVFFEVRSKAPWSESLVWHDGSTPAPASAAMGKGVGLALAFDLTQNPGPVELEVGLSLVSMDQASKNLDAEMPSFAFDDTLQKTQSAWDSLMNHVRVTGGTENQRTMMTAALYHLFLMPTVMSDVDGSYRGRDDQIHTAQGFDYVSDLSLWDTYRTLHPLYAIIAPDRALSAVRSLHEMAKQGGDFPKWPIATNEASTMIGASAEVVAADAFVKGITDFDAEGAYQIMRAAAMDPVAPPGGRGGRNRVEPYLTLGYVPADSGTRSVSYTTEYANNDFALAALAGALGHADDEKALLERAVGYRKLYDPESGFLWSKNQDGSWASAHADPTAFTEEFVEANAWQSLWMVASDIEGLAGLAGGKAKLVDKLDEMFALTKEDFELTDWDSPLSTGVMRSYYWGANEPDINAAYLYSQLGRPDLCQKWIAWLRANLYTPGADGLPGNDDSGTMSAWFVFSALGFYPIAGSDRYVVGAPLFPHAEIEVPGGTFTIDAPEVSDTNIYVQSVKLNGAPLDKAEILHQDLVAGGSLEFTMGPMPSQWARSE